MTRTLVTTTIKVNIDIDVNNDLYEIYMYSKVLHIITIIEQ